MIWFTCAACHQRIAVGRFSPAIESIVMAELVLTHYGEPPVCTWCREHGISPA
jgi:hypothetical protein